MPRDCSQYEADPDVGRWIEQGGEGFYIRYRLWEQQAHEKPESMQFYFNDKAIIEEKLDAGLDGKTHGGVRKKHCQLFVDFVDKKIGPFVSDEDVERLGLTSNATNDQQLIAFRVCLALYFAGLSLTPEQKRILNGALFVRVDIGSTPAGAGSTDKRLFVIPGHSLLEFDQNLDDASWEAVDKNIREALEVVGSRVLNVSGAVQLRFGDDLFPSYKPIVVGDGMVIMGRV